MLTGTPREHGTLAIQPIRKSAGAGPLPVLTLCVLTVGWATQPASAQELERRFQLNEGWNAVFLDLDPDQADPDQLFDQPAILSVWTLDAPLGSDYHFDCDEDSEAGCDHVDASRWRVWYPPGSPHHVINSLNSVRGGRVLMVRTSQAVALTVQGQPNTSRTTWSAGGNLAGFHVSSEPGQSPTFSSYLSGSRSLSDARIHAIAPDGSLIRLDAASERITPGTGYWVTSEHAATYDGPVEIDASSLRGITFAPRLSEHALNLRNLSPNASRVDVDYLGSSAETTSLKWFRIEGDQESEGFSWQPLRHQSWSLEGSGFAGDQTRIRVAPQWRSPQGMPDEIEERGLVRISSADGFERYLPFHLIRGTAHGLWVGNVTIDAVSWYTQSVEPLPTSSRFTFRVILHHALDGTVTFLPNVALVSEDDHSILVAPSCQSTFLTGETSVPRISSAAFTVDQEMTMTGSFARSGQLDMTISILEHDPELPDPADGNLMNPYVHPDNPLHRTGYAVDRLITLTFGDDSGNEWSPTYMAGTYHETVLNLINDPNGIVVTGTFELNRVSDIDTLCDQ